MRLGAEPLQKRGFLGVNLDLLILITVGITVSELTGVSVVLPLVRVKQSGEPARPSLTFGENEGKMREFGPCWGERSQKELKAM